MNVVESMNMTWRTTGFVVFLTLSGIQATVLSIAYHYQHWTSNVALKLVKTCGEN